MPYTQVVNVFKTVANHMNNVHVYHQFTNTK